MKIEHVHESSLAEKIGLQSGDELLEINDNPIRDIIDFRFWANEEESKLLVQRGAQRIEYRVTGNLSDFGVKFAPMKYRHCGNNCIFCFVDQNPKGLRKSLYFKDEDFRLSFLYGNYVTLTNVSRSTLQRIVEQRLSPLYISVHATAPEIRKQMFGLRRDDHLIQKIDFLARNRIEMNVQIVLCPGINDGDVLNQSVTSLATYYPWIKTVAIVPVGLTRHRQGLPFIKPIDTQYAAEIIPWIERRAKEFSKKLNSNFVYLADEFYLVAKKRLPPATRYEGFDQIENGVGITRRMLDKFKTQKLPLHLPRPTQITLVTGKLAESIISKTIAQRLRTVKNVSIQVISITNHFFGDSITVSGLLVGKDIYDTLKKHKLGDTVWLPENCVNPDGLFLDDWTPEGLSEKLGVAIKIVDDDFAKSILMCQRHTSKSAKLFS